MTHKIEESDLHAFVDDRLDDARAEAVMTYLEANPQEMTRVREFMEQKQLLLEGLDAIAATAANSYTDQLRDRLAGKLAGRPSFVWLRTAAAVALLIGSGWLAHMMYQTHVEEEIPNLVEDAAQVHQIFAADQNRAVEIPGSDRNELVTSFAVHLGEPVSLPDLSPIGLALVGGRLLGTEEGPLAQLIYEDGSGRRLTLCMAVQDTEAGTEVHLVEVDGLNAGYWQNGDLTYAVVAETAPEQLLSIVAEISEQKPSGHL
ncbi:anti-sigma factor family protein [Rhodospirillaceae bacterium SYSU D60014]|uniref:anti-sigma factor family protein n=1 Tax=Virgifigura deserti TaxID=2268457 RepID=UPI000E672F21